MFGLQTSAGNQLWRHRLFETPYIFDLIPPCSHSTASVIGVYGGGQHPARRTSAPKLETAELDFGIKERRRAMGIDWMTGSELNQAIPPAYTAWIGERLISHFK
jgi:hypothetical protein